MTTFRKNIQVAIALLFTTITFQAAAQNSNAIVIGEILSMNSEVLSEERMLWIHTPSNMDPNGKYPVVYLLDGSAHLQSVSAMIDYMAGNGLCPQMIVVGIVNTDRTRDLTPTESDPDHHYIKANNRFETAGGGPNFMKFMETELFPYIENKYPTAPYRMFIGHSLGGLTTMDALVHYTHLFNSYVSIDPSMWWSKKSLLNEIQAEKSKRKYEGKAMYLGIANTLDPGTTVATAKADTSSDSEHMRSIISTDEYFKSNHANGLKYASKYYADDDHGTVPFITEYDAIRFIFDFYKLPVVAADRDGDLLTKSVAHFEGVSKEMGYQVLPDEWMINGMGYGFMSEEKYDQAERAFLLNVKNYSKSSNVYDSLGDYYTAVENKEKAIESFEKALEIEEAAHTRSKLEALQNDK